MAGEAAWTQPGVSYPGFINFSRSDQPGHIRALLRTPNQTTVSVLDIPIEDFDQLIADAAKVRQAVESELTQIVEDKHNAQMADLEPDFGEPGRSPPTASDPLGQRAPYDPDGGQTFTAADHAADLPAAGSCAAGDAGSGGDAGGGCD